MGHGANVSALSQRLVQREQSGLLTASIFEWHFLGYLGRSHSRVSVCVCVCLCVCVHALYYFSLQAWNNHAMQQYHWAARPATQWLCFLPTHHSPSCFPAKPATLHLMEFLKSTQVWLFFSCFAVSALYFTVAAGHGNRISFHGFSVDLFFLLFFPLPVTLALKCRIGEEMLA